ncbi:MAG TPA: DUF2723 domain-containing protein [Polyangiaceae bacterium]|nr:DUF2723 domain-containing protein [Polyangiaceae bacterium]
MRRGRGRTSSLAALAGCTASVVYAARLCPDLCLTGDSAELVTAAALWGIPHAPGYPVLTALGHLFAALPWHAVPWRVHLTSAVFHGATVAAMVVAGYALTRSRLGALAAAAALGLSRSFVLGSLYAEVFPLNDLFFACLLALGLRLRAGDPRDPNRSLLLLAATAGLASAHHPMIALAVPAVAMLVLPPALRLGARGLSRGATLALAFAVPLVLAYALVPLAASRSPYLSWGDVHDLRSLVRLVTRQDYGGLWSPVRHPSVEPPHVRVIAFARLVYDGMGPAVVVGALTGVWLLLRRALPVGAALLLAISLPGPAFAWANALDAGSPEARAYLLRFTTMCQVPLALAFGFAVTRARAALGPGPGGALVGALACAAWVWTAFARARDVDLSGDRRGIAFAHDLILGTPDRSLLLLSGDQPANAALYVCGVEHLCGERAIVSPGALALPWRMDQTRRRYPDVEVPWKSGPALRRTHEIATGAAQERPVFVYPDLIEKDPELSKVLTCLPDGLLFRAWPPGNDATAERSAFLASAGKLVSHPCEGCTAVDGPSALPEDFPVGAVYGAAYANHARVARRLGAGDLAWRLEAQSPARVPDVDERW